MRLNRVFNVFNKIFIILIISAVLIALIFPFSLNFYIERKYINLTKNLVNYNPNINSKILVIHDIKRNYLSSQIITKIRQLETNKDILVLQNNIKNNYFNYAALKNNIVEIQTKIVSGFPGFLQQQKILFALTNIGIKGNVITNINPLNLDYTLDLDQLSSVNARDLNAQINYIDKTFKINIDLPKIIYAEEHNKAEIDDIKLIATIVDNNFNLLTIVDRVYLIKNLKPILRIVDFNANYDIADFKADYTNLKSSLSFLRLNVVDQKFGPMATKWQINNFSFPTVVNYINNFNNSIFNVFSLAEISNKLLKFSPSLEMDVLLNTSNGKLKLLTDFTANSKEADWFNKEDILDSLQANIVASVPKKILVELIGLLMEEKLKKENFALPVYQPGNKNNNMAKAIAIKDPKELQRQIEKMTIERVSYLIKNNIITEKEDSFLLDLSIAEGTFYSRMNPFKLFSL